MKTLTVKSVEEILAEFSIQGCDLCIRGGEKTPVTSSMLKLCGKQVIVTRKNDGYQILDFASVEESYDGYYDNYIFPEEMFEEDDHESTDSEKCGRDTE